MLGVGALGYMLYSQNNLKDKLDDVSGKLADAQDQIYQNEQNINNSGLNADRDNVLHQIFDKSIGGRLDVDYPGAKSHDINGFFRLWFRNSSSNTYVVEAVKAVLYIAGYDVDLYIPGSRKAVVLRPNEQYEMKSDWQNRDWFDNSNMAFDAWNKLEATGGYSKPSSDVRLWSASKKMAMADVAVKIRLKESSSTRVVTFRDVPLELYQYPNGKSFDYVYDGNALDWGSDAEF